MILAKPLQVSFAPDFRQNAAYFSLLAEALEIQGVRVAFFGYRRGMPLYRYARSTSLDVFHLHFVDYYFHRHDRLDPLRKLRFVADFYLASRQVPVVYTVHDLYAMHRPEGPLTRVATIFALRQAASLIVHSAQAGEAVMAEAKVPRESITVIPHGDLARSYPSVIGRAEARARLGLGNGKICLAFGTIAPDKGADELVEFWRRRRPPAELFVVGRVMNRAYAENLRALSQQTPNVRIVEGFQSDERVMWWLRAADVSIINYRKVFTSGTASLARSFGIPLLIPHRLNTVDLQEPHPLVFRYDQLQGDFAEKLHEALHTGADYALAEEWRRSTAWEKVAAKTRAVYEKVLGTGAETGKRPGNPPLAETAASPAV